MTHIQKRVGKFYGETPSSVGSSFTVEQRQGNEVQASLYLVDRNDLLDLRYLIDRLLSEDEENRHD